MEVKSHQVITAKCLEFSFEDFWCHVALEMTMLSAELCLTLDRYMHLEVTTAIHAATQVFFKCVPSCAITTLLSRYLEVHYELKEEYLAAICSCFIISFHGTERVRSGLFPAKTSEVHVASFQRSPELGCHCSHRTVAIPLVSVRRSWASLILYCFHFLPHKVSSLCPRESRSIFLTIERYLFIFFTFCNNHSQSHSNTQFPPASPISFEIATVLFLIQVT